MSGSHIRRAVAVALLVPFAGCSSTPGGNVGAPVTPATESVAQEVSTVVEVMADLPWYADVSELAAAADLVVRVRIDGAEVTMSYPNTSIYSSDDPHLNPYAGTGHTPSAAEIEAMGIVATINSGVVLHVVAGSAEVGEAVRVWEMGGTMDGVETRVHGTVPLAELDGELVLFLERHTGDHATASDHHVVGSSQGAFRSADGVVFVSVAEDRTDLVLGPRDWATVADVVDG